MPDSFVVEEDGLATVFGNVPLFFLNLSVYDSPIESLGQFEGMLNLAKRRAGRSQHAWLQAVSSDITAPGWESVAEAHGFSPVMKLRGMAAEALTPPERELPKLEIKPIACEQTYRDIAKLNADAYGVPFELFECMANGHLWQPDSYGCVTYLDGEPVSTTAAFPVDGTIYIALVASSPAHQGKGYAEVAFRNAVEGATKLMGPQRITLHATEAGERLYSRIGFKPYGEFTLLTQASH